MSNNYDWGTGDNSPQQPHNGQHNQQHAAQHAAQHQGPYGNAAAPGTPGAPTESGTQSPKKSSASKAIAIGAVALVAVAALGVGGFQVYKSTQGNADAPLGIDGEVAQRLVADRFDDCMLTPELVEAAGIKDLKVSERDPNICVGHFEGANGGTHSEVRIQVDAESNGDAERSDIEGWREVVREPGQSSTTEDNVDVDFNYVLSTQNSGSSDYYRYPEPGFCRLEGDERELSQIHLTGPSCVSLAPLAKQMMNLVKYDLYAKDDASFFEIKDQPNYAESEPTGAVDVTLPGFKQQFDAAPETGTEIDVLQPDLDGSTFKVTNIVDGEESYRDVCVDTEFTLGTLKDNEDASMYYFPELLMIGSDGSVEKLRSDYTNRQLDEGNTAELQYCGNSFEHSDLRFKDIQYVLIAPDIEGRTYRLEDHYERDGSPNLVAKFTQSDLGTANDENTETA